MEALAVLDAMIAQPGRHAVLRRELVDDARRGGGGGIPESWRAR